MKCFAIKNKDHSFKFVQSAKNYFSLKCQILAYSIMGNLLYIGDARFFCTPATNY